jgi:serine/threonine protein kinase
VQTVKGMQAMQERGLVHNDLKPQNMMVNKDGTVKIIDFGESRFVDEDSGQVPKAIPGGYNTTAGYESPEHWGNDAIKGVDSKADTFALGGIVKTMLDPSISETATSGLPQPVSALGRLASLLNDDDPTKRPSLDAVLMSSLLDQLQEDNNPEDVKDLQKVMSEMNVAMKDLTGTVSGDDFNNRRPQGKGMTDVLWLPYERKIAQGNAEVPLAVMQTMPTKIDDAIRDLQKKMASGNNLEEASDDRQKLARYEEMKTFWLKKISENVARQREEGKAELDVLLEDEWADVNIPGPGGGNMTVGDAKTRKDENLAQIKLIQAEFYALSMTDPVAAQDAMAETNRRLQALDVQNKAVDAAIFGLLGPKGKYFVTEQKLSEVAARFGPRKVTGEEIAEKATPGK